MMAPSWSYDFETALAQSINIPALRLFISQRSIAKSFGLHHWDASQYGLTLVLEVVRCALLDLVGAYTFTNDECVKYPQAFLKCPRKCLRKCLYPKQVLATRDMSQCSDAQARLQYPSTPLIPRSALRPKQELPTIRATRGYKFYPSVAIGVGRNNDNSKMVKSSGFNAVMKLWHALSKIQHILVNQANLLVCSPMLW
jgi:hypothetical protein